MSDRLRDFVVKFCSEWRAGTNARLVVECHAGQAWIFLHKSLGYPPLVPQYHGRPQQPQYKRRPSPSRLRRRGKRAQARAAASAAPETLVFTRTAEIAV